MNHRTRVYLDHAATSWPKSETVIAAMTDFLRDCGAAAGRGGYASAAAADAIVTTVRRQIASLLGAPSSDCVSFHSNGTTALNAAIHGVLRPGDHVVTTAAEHNSVLRPLHVLQQRDVITLDVAPVDPRGCVDPEVMLGLLRDNTRLVAITHASNVTGAVQPLESIAAALRERSTLLLCDAAQTFGTLPINVDGIDLLASPGHKASGGPLGTAFLYIHPAVADHVVPSIQGGTGSQSESLEMPVAMPGKLEAGNLNVPALAGWSAALRELVEEGIESRRQRAAELAERLHRGLRELDGLTLHGSGNALPIASVTLNDLSPTDAAAILDAEFGIETRAGMHCAALIHPQIGSQSAGTLRLSAGHTTTDAEIDAAIQALKAVCTP